MVDLSAWILDRIAEDEAVARAADAPYFLYDLEGKTGEQYDHIARHDPARVLAQCAALREVVELHGELYWFSGARGSEATGKCRMCAENEESDYDGAPLVDWPCPTIRALASIWSSHPDYPLED